MQGAVTASLNAGGKMLEGKTLDAAEWQKDFQGATSDPIYIAIR